MSASAVGSEINDRVNTALWPNAMTQQVIIGENARERVAECYLAQFGDQPALIVADTNTFRVAGRQVQTQLTAALSSRVETFVYDAAHLYAEYGFVKQLRAELQDASSVAVAVGSGTINDLAKRAAGECQRPYMSVATAASMDGYTSFGASITCDGCKQTLPCPAPLAVVVDLDLLAAAPERLNAAGFADLLAKIPSGADWIVADALGIDPIEPHAWSLTQSRLKEWLADPAAVRRGDRQALAGLVEGLIMTGLGMQFAGTTRPASGAEHQFSHLWDMQHHTHNGAAPMHGEKVGIGSIATAALYEQVLARSVADILLDVNAVRAHWPSWEAIELDTRANFPDQQVADQMVAQQRAKYIGADMLVARLQTLAAVWPDLQERLRQQLLPAAEIRAKLQLAGAPYEPEQIGITRERLRTSYRVAQQIRNRYTVLDLVFQTGWWDLCVGTLFRPGGIWQWTTH